MNREFIEYLSARKNETLAVATILFTRGSTPRKAGTSMVVFPDGSIFGEMVFKDSLVTFFENDQEKALAKAIEELELTGSASDKLAQLFALSPVIDAFFDNTMVMAEDEAVKNNRLALLAGLVAKANNVAAFNQLNTK